MRSRADLESMWQYCTRNRPLLARSARAGCLYCEATFAAREISGWMGDSDGYELDIGDTALCPRCGIDAVLPSAAPIQWDATLLSEMHEGYF